MGQQPRHDLAVVELRVHVGAPACQRRSPCLVYVRITQGPQVARQLRRPDGVPAEHVDTVAHERRVGEQESRAAS
ncbi:hypothetical protein OHA81_00090 [Streptomyces sp. NBC_00667]|nr:MULTISPECIES: hypothetical protein [unclassified Streptomyces]WUC68503.1 hypothetical protein OG861_32110 [Streptomyces sp. NBC_00539]